MNPARVRQAAVCLIFAAATILPQPLKAQSSIPALDGPKIQFAEPIADFGRIRSGEVVKHTYYFTNVGNQVLEVTQVQPTCGCTATGDWSRKVEPGQTGTIGIQFNSASFSGAVTKAITVQNNDKTQPTVLLQLKAQVWKPVELVPQFAVLDVAPDATDPFTRVKVLNNTEEHVVISSIEVNNPSFSVAVTTNTPGKSYDLLVRPQGRLKPGSSQAQILVKTSSTNAGVLPVTIWGNVRAAVAITPAQITVGATPLKSKTATSVTIQNNSTNTLNVTDVSVNLPGLEINTEELIPGKVFSITAVLPQGFEFKGDQKAAITFKTSHPEFAEVSVPIVPMVLPVPVRTAATPPAQSAAKPN